MISSIGNRTLILALMVFLTIVGLLISSQISVFGAILLSFVGLPGFLILLAWGGTWFVVYTLLTVGITGIVGNVSLAALLIPMLFVPVIILSAAVKLGYTPLKAIGVALLVATFFSSTTWTVATGFNYNELSLIERHFVKQTELVEQQLQKLQQNNEATQENIEIISEAVKETFAFLKLLVPVTFVFVWHLISLCIIYIAAVKLTPKLGYQLASLPAFATWRFDWNLIWLFIMGWLMFHIVANIEGIPAASLFKAIGANCLAIGKIIYFIAGMSLLFFIFNKYQMGLFARVSLSCLALMFTQAIIWLGIIDVWADFRTFKPTIFSSSEDSYDDF